MKRISALFLLLALAVLPLVGNDKPKPDPNKECPYCHCCTKLKDCNKYCKEGVPQSCVNWPGCKTPGCGKH